MNLLDPEAVCCGFTEKHPTEEKLAEQNASKNSSSNEISRDERIEKLEIQMTRLADDIEMIKNQQCNAESAIQRAINRGVRGLGGRFKLLNDICDPLCSVTSKEERSRSMSQCCSSSSTTSSSIRLTTIKDNTYTPVKENEKKVTEDKNDCAEFVLG